MHGVCTVQNGTDVRCFSFDVYKLILVIFWQKCSGESMLSNGSFISHFAYLMSLHYLVKHRNAKIAALKVSWSNQKLLELLIITDLQHFQYCMTQ